MRATQLTTNSPQFVLDIPKTLYGKVAMTTIAIFDDEKHIHDNARTAISTRFPDYKLMSYFNVGDSLSAIDKTRFDLAIVDIRFENDKDAGYAIIGKLLATYRPPIPMIIFSGEPTVNHAANLKMGAYESIEKTEDYELLTELVDRVLRRAGPAGSDTEFKSNPDGFPRATFRGAGVYLTETQVRIALYLFERAGKPVEWQSLAKLLPRARSKSDGISEDANMSVRTHIKAIRDELRKVAGDEEIITTVLGVGYMWIKK